MVMKGQINMNQCIYILAFCALFLLSFPSFAQDEEPAQDVQENAYTPPKFDLAEYESSGEPYQDAFCEFRITFPQEPEVRYRCEDEEKTRCYNEATFTKVFDLASSLRVRAICNPVSADVKDAYSGEVMQKTLVKLTEKTVTKTFDTSFGEEESFKIASLVGEGMMGRTPSLFVAQLWIGTQSAFSIEAELVGEQLEEPDLMFSKILKSAHYTGVAETEETEGNTETNKEESDKKPNE